MNTKDAKLVKDAADQLVVWAEALARGCDPKRGFEAADLLDCIRQHINFKLGDAMGRCNTKNRRENER
jgi:hypothetical protein